MVGERGSGRGVQQPGGDASPGIAEDVLDIAPLPAHRPAAMCLSAAFHKYAHESVRPEEARRAVSKGGIGIRSPGEYVAVLMNQRT